MGMVQVSVDQVIEMVAVRHPVVTAVGPVHMILGVTTALVLGRAVRGVRCAHRQDVIVHVIAVDMMEMPIVQIVGMLAVPDGRVTTARSMVVVVPVVHVAVLLSHPFAPSSSSAVFIVPRPQGS
jgi:hypothetical protein